MFTWDAEKVSLAPLWVRWSSFWQMHSRCQPHLYFHFHSRWQFPKVHLRHCLRLGPSDQTRYSLLHRRHGWGLLCHQPDHSHCYRRSFCEDLNSSVIAYFVLSGSRTLYQLQCHRVGSHPSIDVHRDLLWKCWVGIPLWRSPKSRSATRWCWLHLRYWSPHKEWTRHTALRL